MILIIMQNCMLDLANGVLELPDYSIYPKARAKLRQPGELDKLGNNVFQRPRSTSYLVDDNGNDNDDDDDDDENEYENDDENHEAVTLGNWGGYPRPFAGWDPLLPSNHPSFDCALRMLQKTL